MDYSHTEIQRERHTFMSDRPSELTDGIRLQELLLAELRVEGERLRRATEALAQSLAEQNRERTASLATPSDACDGERQAERALSEDDAGERAANIE